MKADDEPGPERVKADDDMSELRGLDGDTVGRWMAQHVPGCRLPVVFSLIAGGHSNLTFGATDGDGNRYVVRRGPLGRSGGGAHDMGREYRVIAALDRSPVPVPRALALCGDESVNGSPFYVMGFVDGAVVADERVADAQLPHAEQRARAGRSVVDTLADLHRVDVDAVGLGDAARRDGFIERQIARFSDLWSRNATRELPVMADLSRQLAVSAPAQRYTGIVHGDYRIGNVMIDGSGKVTAVLDWELWTIGDVLADLGFLLNNWYEPVDSTPLVFMDRPPTVSGQFGSRADVISRYAERTGCDVSSIGFYRAFQHWRMAVLAEGVKRRYESAQMASADVDFAHLERRVVDLATLAGAHLESYLSG